MKKSKEAMHKMPADLRKAMGSNAKVMEAWKSLTPLAHNEWICWVTSVKKPETREYHIQRVCEDLINGKRRPCCWAGCKHR
ncbi:MAG: YdeI/OmpD-associated family protein [Nanoarchaeota archaeon]